MDGRDIVNSVRSVYGIQHPKEWIKNQIERGATLHIFDTEKTNTFLKSYGYLASEKEGIRSADMVTENSENVNSEIEDAILSRRNLAGADAVHAAEMAVQKANYEADLKAQEQEYESRIDGLPPK